MSFHASLRVLALCSLLIPNIIPARATAQEQSASDLANSPAYQRMLDLSDEATQAVIDGEFELGAIKFRSAFRQFPDPILLKNEMIAWYRADDCLSALPPAQAFLKSDDVQPEDKDDIQTVQVECHLRLAEIANTDQNTLLAIHHLQALTDLPRDEKAEHRYQKQLQQAEKLETSLRAQFASEPTTSQSTSAATNPRRTLGWTQIAAGVALAGAGAALHTVYLDRKNQLAQYERSDRPEAQLIYKSREPEWRPFLSTARWAIPSTYALAAIAIGSGTFFLIHQPKDTIISPTANSHLVGVTIYRRF